MVCDARTAARATSRSLCARMWRQSMRFAGLSAWALSAGGRAGRIAPQQRLRRAAERSWARTRCAQPAAEIIRELVGIFKIKETYKITKCCKSCENIAGH